ncbi:hypothetical protein [Alteraurantiacibacter buctensis]|uniref:Uncharacterized protein n=1 Tax=Alteraurantiacibacter buctensis TaxID=1503981 RepID=A0A844Z2S7_9SPHN|nr:hypothetical protein [Alteraurantiacibacter buctensis]MXO73291.1 hypothetical protein [Alteraurantiacibacter buctensis]
MKPIRLALLAALVLAPVGLAAMPAASQWEIGPWVRGRNYSEGMPANPDPVPGGGVRFAFPQGSRGQVDAMTTAIGPLDGARSITIRYRVDAAPGTRFAAVETPEMPATVSLYFQRAGDTWTGRGRYGSYRWYAPGEAVIPLEPGERTVTVRLDAGWTNVNGKPVSDDPAGFAAARAEAATLGLAFGSLSRRSHGVHADGRASFTLLGLRVD